AGRELGVRYILEGSVRKAQNRIRVTGQLIEAETGRHVWADRYDRTLDDVFAIQDELTMSVVAAIEPSLRQAEIERVKRKRPDSLDAYDLVLRAIPHVYPAMPDDAAKALPLLESALKMQPDYALAHGFAAWSHEILFARAGARDGSCGRLREGAAASRERAQDAPRLRAGARICRLEPRDRVRTRGRARGDPPRGDPSRPCGNRTRARRRPRIVARRLCHGYRRARPRRRASGLRGGAGDQPILRNNLHVRRCRVGLRRRH